MSINSVNSNQNTVTQKNKNGAIVGASTLGAGAGLGAGYLGAMKIADEFIKQNGKIIDNPKLVDNYIDDLGDLVADFAQGKSIKEGTTEARTFFNTKLRPRDTVAIEDFIKKNNFDSKTNPKEIKEAFKKFAKEDEAMKKYIEKYLNTTSGIANAKADKSINNPFKLIKNYFEGPNSLNMAKEGNKALKKCKIAIIGGAVAGAALIGGITAAIVKCKNNKNEKTV